MPPPNSETVPETQWLWPWPPEITHGFFQPTGGHLAAAPGPEPSQANLKCLRFTKSIRDTEQARQLAQTGIQFSGLPSLTPEQLELVSAHPNATNKGTFTYIEVNIAVLSLTRLKEECDIDWPGTKPSCPKPNGIPAESTRSTNPPTD